MSMVRYLFRLTAARGHIFVISLVIAYAMLGLLPGSNSSRANNQAQNKVQVLSQAPSSLPKAESDANDYHTNPTTESASNGPTMPQDTSSDDPVPAINDIVTPPQTSGGTPDFSEWCDACATETSCGSFCSGPTIPHPANCNGCPTYDDPGFIRAPGPPTVCYDSCYR
jgi:hypothetical protein